jgi:hypothetical protein
MSKTFKAYYPYLIFFIAVSSALTTVMFKGEPSLFFSNGWLAVFGIGFSATIYLSFTCLIKKDYLKGICLGLLSVTAMFFWLNSINFKYEEIPPEDFNDHKSSLLSPGEIILYEHGYGDTDKLLGYERAVFIHDKEPLTAELNKPLYLSEGRKIILTGGRDILVTQSLYIFHTAVAAILFALSLLAFAVKEAIK